MLFDCYCSTGLAGQHGRPARRGRFRYIPNPKLIPVRIARSRSSGLMADAAMQHGKSNPKFIGSFSSSLHGMKPISERLAGPKAVTIDAQKAEDITGRNQTMWRITEPPAVLSCSEYHAVFGAGAPSVAPVAVA